jgi:hypothetical protein
MSRSFQNRSSAWSNSRRLLGVGDRHRLEEAAQRLERTQRRLFRRRRQLRGELVVDRRLGRLADGARRRRRQLGAAAVRPHLQHCQRLANVAVARRENALHRQRVDVQIAQLGDHHQPRARLRPHRLLVLQLFAVVAQRAHLGALAVVADADDRHQRLLDQRDQRRRAAAVARRHAVDLVHDHARLVARLSAAVVVVDAAPSSGP